MAGTRQGVIIYDVSGRNVGQVNTSGRILVDAAGVTVSASGIGLNISGQTVYLVSGQNAVQVSGATVIALISGQTVVGDFTADISGQIVYLFSGQNNVQMSGQTIKLTSGDTVNALILDGQDGSNKRASVQDAIVTIGTGDESLSTIDHLYGFVKEFNNWAGISATQSGHAISGIVNKLVVGFSGDNVFEHGSALITNPLTQVTSDSGGVVLSSGSVFSVTLNNISGNAPVWVGGTGSQAPFSGKGLIVYPGGGLSLKIDSVDDVRVFGETSGQFVSWIGVQK